VSVITGDEAVLAWPNVSLPANVTVPAEIVAELVLLAPVGPATGEALVVTFVQPALGQVPLPPFQVKSSARPAGSAARAIQHATTVACERTENLLIIAVRIMLMATPKAAGKRIDLLGSLRRPPLPNPYLRKHIGNRPGKRCGIVSVLLPLV
jgi:hypothetical protein